MRLAALLACLALVACSPTELGQAPDASPCASACGAGTVCELGRCVPLDAGTAAETGADVPLDHGGDDVPAPMDVVDVQQLVDVGEADAGAADVGSADNGVVDVGARDVGVDAPTAADVPVDVQVMCTGGDKHSCSTHRDCQTQCLPHPGHSIWCCTLGGQCYATTNPVCPAR